MKICVSSYKNSSNANLQIQQLRLRAQHKTIKKCSQCSGVSLNGEPRYGIHHDLTAPSSVQLEAQIFRSLGQDRQLTPNDVSEGLCCVARGRSHPTKFI